MATDFLKGLTRGINVAKRAKAAHSARRAKPPGKFAVHAGKHLRFFDTIGSAQDFAEKHPTALVRRDYGDDKGHVDSAKWDGVLWTYIHRKVSKKRR